MPTYVLFICWNLTLLPLLKETLQFLTRPKVLNMTKLIYFFFKSFCALLCPERLRDFFCPESLSVRGCVIFFVLRCCMIFFWKIGLKKTKRDQKSCLGLLRDPCLPKRELGAVVELYFKVLLFFDQCDKVQIIVEISCSQDLRAWHMAAPFVADFKNTLFICVLWENEIKF